MVDELSRRLQAVVRTLKARRMDIGPRRTEAELAAFERAYGVALPREYRRFLLEVGDGGEGPPHYGIVPLGHVPDDYQLSADEVLGRLAEPFPETEAWVWEDEPDPDPERIEAVGSGALVLGTDGCGLYSLLVVTGDERGKIWTLADVGVAPVDPPADFLSWYEDWLATSR